MSRKPETVFILSVHKHLPSKKVPHREKMNNPYRSGTADVWYSGMRADIWIEYKFIPKFPKQSKTITADLTALQKKWLRERHYEGRKIYVIIGFPSGGIILSNLEWETPLDIAVVEKRLLERKELAAWIVYEVEGDINDDRNGRIRSPRKVDQASKGAGNLRGSVRTPRASQIC